MELLLEDLKWCIKRLPKRVEKLMKEKGNKLMLAGGFIRACVSNEKPNDIDLFSASSKDAELFVNIIKKDTDRVIKTDYAYTLVSGPKPPIQFIHKWTYENPTDVLPSFDFTIARAMIWFNGELWQSLCDDRFYADLAAKRLVYCSPKRIEEVGGSMLRVLKFYQKGYRIPLDSLGAVIARIHSGLDQERIQEQEKSEQEEYCSKVLTGLLREVDPNIDPTHIAHLPSTRKDTE